MEECYDIESSGSDMVIVLVSSQKPWFSAKDLYKILPAKVPVWTGKELLCGMATGRLATHASVDGSITRHVDGKQ